MNLANVIGKLGKGSGNTTTETPEQMALNRAVKTVTQTNNIATVGPIQTQMFQFLSLVPSDKIDDMVNMARTLVSEYDSNIAALRSSNSLDVSNRNDT